MAAPASQSLFMRLTNAFRSLSLRSDIDNIILELLGQFSLEKIYAESDKDTYQNLVITLLAELNAIFSVQRLTLPSENLQLGWYLGFLASWEVTLRAVEFVLLVVVEGRESLWEARLLREKYLAELLLNALRFLTLHPKIPASQRAKDRRDRFARIHRSLERVFDSYPGPESFLLLVCREITDSLRTEPNGLALPPRLRIELPNLASELYPLPDCLSSQYVATIVPQEGFPGDWLVHFLALRDVSLFVVWASVQYTVNQETRDVRLQSSSARTRNAILHALENLRMPAHLSKMDLVATFNDTFRIILPDTLNLGRRGSGESDECEIDAIDLLCTKLNDRQVVNRVSDREMMHSISEVTRNIALLDDPSGQFRAARPKIWALNCQKGHIVGESQLRAEGIEMDVRDGAEVVPFPQHKGKCIHCGGLVTIAREVSLARRTWDLLKPLESNADTINVERHLPTQFLLNPPKAETGMPFHPGYGNILGGESSRIHDTEPSSPPPGRSMFPGPLSSDRANLMPQSLVSLNSSGYRHNLDTPRTEFAPSEEFTSSDGRGYTDTSKTSDPPRRPSNISTAEIPITPESSSTRGQNASRLQSISTESFEPEALTKSRTVQLLAHPERGKSKSWRSKFGSRKEPPKPSGDSSSLSSTTLEPQSLEEISLKALASSSKVSVRGKSSKSINVYISQNSTYALFWTQAAINVWDIGSSSPYLGRAISTDSICVLAAVTKVHLAYIIGTRDQKLTLRIVNLIRISVPVIEYRMPSSPWCSSITICPKENQVVVGFDNSVVRFFETTKSEEPREDRLHSRFHKDCKHCPAVDTLSFSNDGLVLLASTRTRGTIQVYSWRFPFVDFQELTPCRYHVPLHESEDNGTTSAIFRSGTANEDNLVCLTTWTQSGTPILVQPYDGHRSEIRTETSSHQGKLGSRIQCAAFSPTGRELAMVNDKGHLYMISNLNSNPLEVRRIATSKELTTKSDWFAMEFVSLPGEEAIVLAWADSSKAIGYVKKLPVKYNNIETPIVMTPLSPGAVQVGPRYELQECVAKGDVTPVIGLLEEHFEEIAQQEFDWLHELLDIGCSFEEMARLLIDGEVSSPWIPIETPFSASKPPSIGLHQPNCVHSGGRKLDTRPRVNSVGLLKTHEALPMSKIKEMIGECCGIAGVLPPNSNPPWWRSGSSLVHFTGERNSVAWISYSKPGVISDLQTLSLNILGALDSILCTIGFLQEVGLCCDSFTILRLEESNKAIELCRVPLSLIKNLRMTVEHWKGNILDSHQRQGCFKSAREIIRSILGDLGTAEIAKIFDTDDPYTTLNVCALVVQILFLGILSYSQAHTGHLRPEFLFEPLEEVHLLGTSMVEFMSRKHVVVELLDFACMKDMLQDSVLVFRLSSDVFGSPSRDSQNSDWITKYDLFASPEDLADTWGPARFVTDSTHGHRLLAIEVGGGTIIRAATGEEKEEKLHWSAGPAPYRAQKLTFNSRDKVLIGATTVNDKCPLDEHKSWRHPLTNAYIQHLGTRDHSWELRERQAGFQGGQYAILQFNATYIKQNGVTLKQQQLMLPFNEIDLAFLNSNCGLQISFCTGLSRRVALRELLADVVVPFIESRLAKPAHWEELKTQYAIVENFRHGDLETWFDQLSLSLRETAIHIVRSMLEVLKDTGIDRNGEELVIAWVRKESPYSCLRLRCEKTSLWARILADSEDCATFACITPLCLEIRQHACRNLEVAPWHNVSNLLDTEVCQHLSNRDIQTVTNTLAPWTLQHQVSYWIGKSGTNLIAKVWLTNEDAEPRLVVRQKVIPEKYRARLPRVMVERLGRLREKQIGDSIAKQVVILAQI